MNLRSSWFDCPRGVWWGVQAEAGGHVADGSVSHTSLPRLFRNHHTNRCQVGMHGNAFSIKVPEECFKMFAATLRGKPPTRANVLRIFLSFSEYFWALLQRRRCHSSCSEDACPACERKVSYIPTIVAEHISEEAVMLAEVRQLIASPKSVYAF